MTTTINLTREQIERYRSTIHKRYELEKAEIEQRRKLAWKAANRAAVILKQQFNATRVVAFGSLVRESSFTKWSDVDIAAWGIAPEDTFHAIGIIAEMESSVPVNLVDVNTARPSLRETIQQDGIDL